MDMKKSVLSLLLAATAVSTGLAQRIDFNMYGRSVTEGTAPGYSPWTFGRVTSASEKFATQNGGDSVTVAITYVAGLDAGNGIRTNYWKTGVVNQGYKLIGDMAIVITLQSDNNYTDIKSGSSGLQLTVTGLSAGEHTLMAYHSNTDGITDAIAPLDVLVNGVTVATGVQQRARSVKASECPYSYIHFQAEEGKSVVIQYVTKPEAGVTYGSTAVALNALVFDEPNPITTASNPSPAHQDYHVDADSGACVLSWTAAKTAVKHHLMLGTASGELQEVATLALADTSYTLRDLYSMNTYYWRVDEENETGVITQSEEWSFRPRQLAFPGAEGYGRFAIGGRGGVVYHVTNLSNDKTPGSFIYGVTELEGPRTIVFDVSGIIEMDFGSVFVDPYTTIAAQTAPGKGICLKKSNVNIGSESICRFLRARRGYGDTGNALGVTGSDHTIIDHCTAAWGTDETFSGRGARNITFQYSMIAEALGIADHKNYPTGTNHGYAATIDGRIGSYSHNLLVDCQGRNWSLGGGMDGNNKAIGQMDLLNNVVYNWGGRTTDGGCHEVNFVGNYYKMGVDTKKTVLFSQDYENIGSVDSKWQAYISGNIRENKNHTLSTDKYGDTYQYTLSNGATDPNKRTDEYAYKTFVSEPFFPSYAVQHTAKDAFKIVTSTAGATMPCRDDHHLRMVSETVNGTWTYTGSRSGIRGEIDHEDDCGGFEVFPEETRPADFDTDQDGMPDWYEKITGSNPNVADNNLDPNRDGWTLLEDYLELMAHPYVVVAPRATQTVNVAPFFRGFTKSPVYTVASVGENFCDVTVSDSTITVKALEQSGIATLTMTVTDAEGTVYGQRLSVVVTDDPTAIDEVWDESSLEVVSREFFTLDGKPATQLQSQQTYLMRLTDAKGQQYTVKVIKN